VLLPKGEPDELGFYSVSADTMISKPCCLRKKGGTVMAGQCQLTVDQHVGPRSGTRSVQVTSIEPLKVHAQELGTTLNSMSL
jgi:hypothetical protein